MEFYQNQEYDEAKGYYEKILLERGDNAQAHFGLGASSYQQGDIEVAKENLNITLEKYRLGSIVPLELREAQRNYIDATARYVNALYQAKIGEITLNEITGSIIPPISISL